MKSHLPKALVLAAAFMLVGCETTTNSYGVSDLEKQYYAGCASEPPADPTCGHH